MTCKILFRVSENYITLLKDWMHNPCFLCKCLQASNILGISLQLRSQRIIIKKLQKLAACTRYEAKLAAPIPPQ